MNPAMRRAVHRVMNQWKRVLLAVIAAACCGASARAVTYSGLYVFGDSLSDPGNNAVVFSSTATPPTNVTLQSDITSNAFLPSFPYASSLQYSNADVWAYRFATLLGLPTQAAAPVLGGGTNYALGGARTGPLDPNGILDQFPASLQTQVQTFVGSLGASPAPADALYVVAGGGNNARDAMNAIASGSDATTTIAATAAAYAADIGNIVDALQGKGARQVVVWNVGNIGRSPFATAGGAGFSSLGTQVAQAMNEALAGRMAGETDVIPYDSYGTENAIFADPATFGLTNVSDAFGAAFPVGGDPATYFFWDGIHPTSSGHRIIADSLYAAVVPEPSPVVLLVVGCVAAVGHRRRR